MKKQSKLYEELIKYGYVFSVKKSMAIYISSMCFVLFLGKFFGLGAVFQAVLCVYTLILMPFFYRNSLKNRYEQKRFSDINIYMEQFLYSFNKTGKIVETIQDVKLLFEEGEMRNLLDEVLNHILHTYNESEVEKNALKIIEEKFPYSGVKTMHSFALQVEKNGGKYNRQIRLLLEARRMWADRMYALLKEKKKQRTEILLSIIVSLLLCTMIYYISEDMQTLVADNAIVQLVTLLVLMLDLMIYYFADKKLSCDYIADIEDESEYIKQYERLKQYDDKRLVDRLAKRAAIKNLNRVFEEKFPAWLMQVSLLLQTENVHMAIIKSYNDAPEIIKEPLKQMIYEMEENPESMSPYINFLSEFTLPEVRSSMKMLHSLSEGSGGDAEIQIEDIIRRNQRLLEQAAKMENEDIVARMYLLFLAPQITGGVKLICDMLFFFMSYMQTLTNGNTF